MREDLAPEPESADAEKITAIHRMTGNQYFQNTAARVTGAMEAGPVGKDNGKGRATPHWSLGRSPASTGIATDLKLPSDQLILNP